MQPRQSADVGSGIAAPAFPMVKDYACVFFSYDNNTLAEARVAVV
jgi:hypothetical protein